MTLTKKIYLNNKMGYSIKNSVGEVIIMPNNSAEDERFSRVENFSRYIVSSHGRVFALRPLGLYELSQKTDKDGYKSVALTTDNPSSKQIVHIRVHRLVLMAFNPTKDTTLSVNHKNEVRDDNRIENLEWCTVAYNNSYKYTRGYISPLRGRTGENCGGSRPVECLNKDGERVALYTCKREAQKDQKTCVKTINKSIKTGFPTPNGLVWRLIA